MTITLRGLFGPVRLGLYWVRVLNGEAAFVNQAAFPNSVVADPPPRIPGRRK